jgi:hypothetical protein
MSDMIVHVSIPILVVIFYVKIYKHPLDLMVNHSSPVIGTIKSWLLILTPSPWTPTQRLQASSLPVIP